MAFGKYILQFMKNTDASQTHLSFNKGKYNVPDNKYNDFYKNYFKAMIAGEELYLIEKVYRSNFAFFLDLDAPKKSGLELTDDIVKKIIKTINQVIMETVSNSDENSNINSVVNYIVSKRCNKYHINYPGLVVNNVLARNICDRATKLSDEDKELFSCIDTSVYNTGLRMLGSKKSLRSTSNVDVYKIYDIETGMFTDFTNTPFEIFMKTIVRRPSDTPLITVKDEYKNLLENAVGNGATNPGQKKITIRGVDNQKIEGEIIKLLEYCKSHTACLKNYNMEISRIYTNKNRMGMFCYYVSIGERHCPFMEREHQRASNPIYIEISSSGLVVKCHDQDCLRKRYPESGIPLPPDFKDSYHELYLSMTTKYWKTDVVLTDDIKRYLEESLTGSHYQIAKTAFGIYKDRFRVDDVKNTTWYEFDGVRWNKSHSMNILISEELPKYYRGIKISDTSVKSDDLKEFLSNDDKIDSNLRNQMVDNIITRLENVNFKSNIINQITYLYKTHDPDFYVNLDSNPFLMGFKNGVYDFKQNTFRKSQLTDYITFSTGYDWIEYDENSEKVQEIYSFLEKIIPNRRVLEYLLKVLGSALVGVPDEKFYIWTGISGANGKSTLVNFLESTLGDYTTAVDVSLLTNRRANGGNASPDVVRLRGKRVFTFQEPEHDDKLRTGILKQFTGGDTITARELFKAPVTFKLQGTMIMCCNDLPSVASIDGGTWRRIRVIEFKSRFCDNPVKENEFAIDPTIKYKLVEWRPYFMSILIHWYNKYLYEGIEEPEEVLKATTKYKVENDKFNEFFDEVLEEVNFGSGNGNNSKSSRSKVKGKDNSHLEEFKTIYMQLQNWWFIKYPTTKPPSEKELKRALKIKYGDEREYTDDSGMVKRGFCVVIKTSISENFE